MKKLFLLGGQYDEDRGSYAGVFQELAKVASKEGYNVKILAGKSTVNQPFIQRTEYAEIIRFSKSKIKIRLLGSNWEYLRLSKYIKNYFLKIQLKKKT